MTILDAVVWGVTVAIVLGTWVFLVSIARDQWRDEARIRANRISWLAGQMAMLRADLARLQREHDDLRRRYTVRHVPASYQGPREASEHVWLLVREGGTQGGERVLRLSLGQYQAAQERAGHNAADCPEDWRSALSSE